MKIKAKCSFSARDGFSMTAGEVKIVSDEQGKKAVDLKLAEATTDQTQEEKKATAEAEAKKSAAADKKDAAKA